MRQSEDRRAKQESKREPQNRKTAFRTGDVVITPRRLLKFVIFFAVCLALAIFLVSWIFK